jgi:hypothetical protein
MNQQVRLGDVIGSETDNFKDFDLTEVQQVLNNLRETEAIDLAHAEFLQQQALRGADILSEYLGKMVKIIGFLETEVNKVKNKVSLEYQAPEGSRTTTDMKIWAAGASLEVEKISINLAEAKASKMVLEKKFDIIIRQHHHYKDISQGLRRTILGYGKVSDEKVPEGW